MLEKLSEANRDACDFQEKEKKRGTRKGLSSEELCSERKTSEDSPTPIRVLSRLPPVTMGGIESTKSCDAGGSPIQPT